MKTLLLAAITLAVVGGIAVFQYRAFAQDATKENVQSQNTTTAQIKEALTCNLGAMTPAERKHYEALKKQLRAATRETKELVNGFAFRFEGEPKQIMAAAEFITLEGRCCSFYSFALEVAGDGGPMWLRITGPEAAKDFIKDALVQ